VRKNEVPSECRHLTMIQYQTSGLFRFNVMDDLKPVSKYFQYLKTTISS